MRKIEANRRNALRSTGPRTEAGKARAAQNARLSTGPRTSAGKARAAQNALLSTGPRTHEGRARAAQNARRHGLTLSACRGTYWSDEIAILARQIAGGDADAERHELACRTAAAQIDVVRARRARRDLLPAMLREPGGVARVAAIDDYERRALARRKSAIRDFDEVR